MLTIPSKRSALVVKSEVKTGGMNWQHDRPALKVKSHVKAILRKLGARDRAHAVAIVLGRGVPHR